jgi:hypothetical protein
MTFVLDMWYLGALFAMPVSLARCLQAIRNGSLVRLQRSSARSPTGLQGSLAEKYCCLQARPLLFASHYTYGPSWPHLWQRAAVYVDKLLKGAKPADLPVEQPMRFELVINLKTAEALGITISPTLLFQATKMIR